MQCLNNPLPLQNARRLRLPYVAAGSIKSQNPDYESSATRLAMPVPSLSKCNSSVAAVSIVRTKLVTKAWVYTMVVKRSDGQTPMIESRCWNLVKKHICLRPAAMSKKYSMPGLGKRARSNRNPVLADLSSKPEGFVLHSCIDALPIRGETRICAHWMLCVRATGAWEDLVLCISEDLRICAQSWRD